MIKIKYFDMFAGVGGFRTAMEQIDGMQCVGYCEIDVHAQKSYRALFDTKGEWFMDDATKIDPNDMPDFDLLCGGFPCQSFSVAGKRLGFEDTRGTLFFDVARILGQKKPAFVCLENVPGLLSHDKGRTYRVILNALSDLGYHVEWACYNSKDFGVPQSRNRVFIIGYLDERCRGKILPIAGANPKALVQVVAGRQGERIYDPAGMSCTLASQAGGFAGQTGLYAVGFNRKDGITKEIDTAYALNASNFRGLNRNQTQNAVFVDMCYGNPQITNTARCLTAHYAKSCMSNHKAEKSGVLRIHGNVKRGYHEAAPGDSVTLSYATSDKRHTRVMKSLSHTLDTNGAEGVVTICGRIRKLTPRECFRLQGFRDEQIDKILAVTSDSQAYKQAGNSVCVNVVHAIASCVKAAFDSLKAGDAG